MTVRSRFLLLVASCLAASCGSGTDSRFDVILVGDAETALSDGMPMSDAAAILKEATGSGIVGLDAEGRIRPDLADRWIVTDDGLSYIFRFENGESEDSPTAPEVRRALLAAIKSLRGTALGLDLSVIDGVFARTNQVVEIRLKTALPEFLQLLAAPELALRFDDRTTGALALEGDEKVFTLSRPSVQGDAPGATLDIRVAGPTEAVARFQRGEAELLLGGNIDALPHVKMGGLLRGTIRLDPVTGMFGLAVADDRGFLSRPANREALAMAIDRQALIEPFNIGGWSPRARLVPAGLPGTAQPPGPWDGFTIEQRQGVAAQRVAGWVASEGPVPPITVALPEGAGGDILFRRISLDLGKIGLAAKRLGRGEAAQLRLVDEVAWLDRPEWYLHRLNCRVVRGACSAEADALVAEAIAEPDAARRTELLRQAEALLTETNAFISFGPPIRFSLVRGGVDGFAVNRWGLHPLSQHFPATN